MSNKPWSGNKLLSDTAKKMKDIIDLEPKKDQNFSPVTYKKRKARPRAQVGKCEMEHGISWGKGMEEKKIWLYISKIKDNITAETIQEYITNKTKTDKEVKVKKLDTKTSRKNNKAFMIGVDFSLKEKVYKEDFWPAGITFTRFNFAFGRRFLDLPGADHAQAIR